MKILITGEAGQVGSNLIELCRQKNIEYIAPTIEQLDFSKPSQILEQLNALNFKPDIIINAAAYTAVDKAEDEKELCDNINHLSVLELANYSAENNVFFVHYSTDYVFNGSGEASFREDNTTSLNPLNIYGKTKLDGERAVINSGCNYFIFRTSWVYNHIGANFVLTMLKLMQEREELKIINDQIGSPTYALDIANATLDAIQKTDPLKIDSGNTKEIFHLCPPEQISWYDFAVKIKDIAKNSGYNLQIKNIEPIPTSAYPTKATRPLNSRLSVEKLSKKLGITLPSINESLQICFARINFRY